MFGICNCMDKISNIAFHPNSIQVPSLEFHYFQEFELKIESNPKYEY